MKTATIYDYARMCKAHRLCGDCPVTLNNNNSNLQCMTFVARYPDKANEIILKWCEEHPVETRRDRLLKTFPNAKIDNCGIPIFCPRWVDKDFKCNRERLSCDACEKEYWLAEIGENDAK